MLHLVFKAIHIIGFISWFAGLLYIPRLFIYDLEAIGAEGETAIRDQLRIMQRRLWLGITWPAMLITLAAGSFIMLNAGFYTQPWMHLKLGLLLALVGYHLYTHVIYRAHQLGKPTRSSTWLRVWNEVATLFMVAIVLAAVVKNEVFKPGFLVGLGAFAASLALGIEAYRRVRTR